MTKNLKVEEINITLTTDPSLISGSLRTRQGASEVIQQGTGWSILAFNRIGQLTDGGVKKLSSLLSHLVWMKSEKTRSLREIKKTINNTEKEWKEKF